MHSSSVYLKMLEWWLALQGLPWVTGFEVFHECILGGDFVMSLTESIRSKQIRIK